MKGPAPDDISDFQRSDFASDHAHYDGEDDGDASGASLSTTGYNEGGGGEITAESFDLADLGKLADKQTTGTLAELLKGRNVYLVRHGKTEKAAKDEDRKLSSVAEHQCANFLALYGSELDRVVYAFASPTVRTVATASFLGFPDPVTVPYLYFKTYYTEEMQAIDDQLGYAPLSDYLDVNEGKGEEIYAPIRKKLGQEIAVALGKQLKKAKACGEYEGDVLIVTHGTTVGLLAQEVLRAIKSGLIEDDEEGEEDKVLAMNTGEVEGFAVTSDGKVRLLVNDQSETPMGKNDDYVEE